MSRPVPLELALGPILPFWDRPAVFDFYTRVAALPVDTVYLGEAVCSKRRALDLDDWLELAAMLRDAGKQVVLTTLALIEADSELGILGRQCAQGSFPVEANSMAAVRLRAGRGPFVIGPHVNVYNAETLAVLGEQGATRWVPPVELDGETLAAIAAARPPGMTLEVFAFGRLPLAFSARCFTARALGLAKDDCGFRCGGYPEGMPLATQDDTPFLVINGIQTQSALTCNLLGLLPELRAAGADAVRLSPQREGMEAIIAAYRAAIDGSASPAQAQARIAPWLGAGECDGYWRGAPGMAHTPPPE